MFFYRTKSKSRIVTVIDLEQKLGRKMFCNHEKIYTQYLQDLVFYKQQLLNEQNKMNEFMYERNCKFAHQRLINWESFFAPFSFIKKHI